MLPGMDGMEVCATLRRERRPCLILMLTAKDALQDKVEGLQAGADDYLTKPFAFDELLARLRALLRRSRLDAGRARAAGRPARARPRDPQGAARRARDRPHAQASTPCSPT